MRPVLLLLIFFTLKLFSQDEQPNYERFVSVFTERFNSGDYDGIYDMYDPGMKNAFTNIETRNFFENNINRLTGEIKSMQFYTLQEGAHVYRVVFDKSVADLTVTLSPESKITLIKQRITNVRGTIFYLHDVIGVLLCYLFQMVILHFRNSTPIYKPFPIKWQTHDGCIPFQ